MKKIHILLFIALIAISCAKEETNSNTRVCTEVEYDIDFEIKLGEEVCFPDDNTLNLTNIEHALCPCQIECDWEGGLYITLSTSANGDIKEKKFYSNLLYQEPAILNSHEIISVSYKYDSESGEIPSCIKDFEAEKTTLSFTLSKK